MDATQKRRGLYLGTKTENNRWRRYTKEEFLNRGSGEYWIKDGSLFFQHDGSRHLFSLPLRKLSEIKICPCGGRKEGIPVISLVWEKDGRWLSSGFVFSGLLDQSNNLLARLRIESLRT